MKLQQLYDWNILGRIEKKRIQLLFLSWMIVLCGLCCIAGTVFCLYTRPLACTVLSALLGFFTYFTAGVLLGVKRQRLQAYGEFLTDLETGLPAEGIYTAQKISDRENESRYGLRMRQIDVMCDGKKAHLYIESSIDCPLEAGELYYMQVVGAFPLAVKKYDH